MRKSIGGEQKPGPNDLLPAITAIPPSQLFNPDAAGEQEKEAAEGIRRGKGSEANQMKKQRVATVPGEMGKPFGPQGEAVEPRQQDIRDRNMIIRPYRQGMPASSGEPPEANEFEVEP